MFSIYNQFNSREQKNKTNLEAINKLCGAIFEKKYILLMATEYRGHCFDLITFLGLNAGLTPSWVFSHDPCYSRFLIHHRKFSSRAHDYWKPITTLKKKVKTFSQQLIYGRWCWSSIFWYRKTLENTMFSG